MSAGELALIQACSEGLTQAAFSRASGITMRTLNTRAVRAFRKLNVHSMPHAVAICMAKGLIPGPLVCDCNA